MNNKPIRLKILTIMKKEISNIFNAFRAHIVDICQDAAKRAPYLVCDDERKRATLFTRTRVWTFANVVHAVMCCFKRTLSVEVAQFLETENLPQTTPEAYIERRALISDELFKDLNLWLNQHLYETGTVQQWKCGKYLCGIDGTRLSLPYTEELYKKYRQRDDKGYNLARGLFVTDLVNRTIVMADMYPNKTEERKAALESLTSDTFPYPLLFTVFVMDRGYPSLYLMNWFAKNTGGFIIRARRDTNPQVAAFMDSDKSSETVTLKLSPNRRDIDYPDPAPLEVRLVKRPPLEDEEVPTVYITNLDADQYPDEVIRNAYRMRWNSETEIGTAKNELQIEIFSGTREICIRQDFFAALILYNIESVIRLFCNKKLQSHTGKYKVQVSMNSTWLFTCLLIMAMFRSERILDRELTFSVKMFLRMHSLIRPGRSYPRKKKKIKSSGKYITLTNYKRGL